jgi:cytochrome bd ubiquinol oxidase subunit I
VVTESGRQPWIVQGVLRTVDATSPVLGASIAVTLALFVIVYGIVFWMGIYYINRLIALGPSRAAVKDPEYFSGSPISASAGAGRRALKKA